MKLIDAVESQTALHSRLGGLNMDAHVNGVIVEQGPAFLTLIPLFVNGALLILLVLCVRWFRRLGRRVQSIEETSRRMCTELQQLRQQLQGTPSLLKNAGAGSPS